MTAARAIVPDVPDVPDAESRRQVELDESFVSFLQQSYPKIEAFLLRQCDDRDLVEEALQEALIAAMAHWARVSQHAQPLYWVRKTAWHKLMNLLDQQPEEPVSAAPATLTVRPPATPREAQLLLSHLLTLLPPRQRAVLALACDGDTDEEIAKQLDLAVTTVRTYKIAARKRLAELAPGLS